MSLSKPSPDNPARGSGRNGDSLPVRFSALKASRYVEQVAIRIRYWLSLTLALLVAVVILKTLGRGTQFTDPPYSHERWPWPGISENIAPIAILESIQQVGLLALSLMICLRTWLRSPLVGEVMNWLTILLCFATHPDAYLETKLVLSGALVYFAFSEFARHWTIVNPSWSAHKGRDFRLAFSLVLIVGNLGTLIISMLARQDGVSTCVLAAVNFTITVAVWSSRRCPLRPMLTQAVLGFLFYPESSQLAKGSIRSPLSSQATRLFPILLAVFSVSLTLLHVQEQASIRNVLLAIAVSIAFHFSLLTALVAVNVVPCGQDWSTTWKRTIETNRRRGDEKTSQSIFVGRVEADGSPVLVDRDLLMEHVHFLGSTGSGKTVLGLIPLAEQIIASGKSSLAVIDLKGDKHEILASCTSACRELAERTGQVVPVKLFSLEDGEATHAFNPFLTTGWQRLSEQKKTETLCNALGINYGPGYGRGFFSDSPAAVVYAAIRKNPEFQSFRELHESVDHVVMSSKPVIPNDLRRSGAHVWQLVGRLATIDAINQTSANAQAETLEHQIDFAEAFQSPHLIVFRLPSTLAANSASAIANMAAYSALNAGQISARKVRMHFLIDEFQRMAADSLTQLFQMARSLDISMILANQSIEDLRAVGKTIADAVEGGCAWRQWFSVSGMQAIRDVADICGLRDELRPTLDEWGDARSYLMEPVPRLTVNNLAQISDDAEISLIHLTGDRSGLASYAGLPFIVRSGFHISSEEYERRKAFSWPRNLPGMIIAGESPLDLKERKGRRRDRAGSDSNDPLDFRDVFDSSN
ncbi:MAG: TraM recognition domain-containing protein [Planctomycetota bacterium]